MSNKELVSHYIEAVSSRPALPDSSAFATASGPYLSFPNQKSFRGAMAAFGLLVPFGHRSSTVESCHAMAIHEIEHAKAVRAAGWGTCQYSLIAHLDQTGAFMYQANIVYTPPPSPAERLKIATLSIALHPSVVSPGDALFALSVGCSSTDEAAERISIYNHSNPNDPPLLTPNQKGLQLDTVT